MELAKDSQGRTFLFGDYDAGRVVECNDPEMIIGTHAFELSMTITPTAKGYGILASHDRSCDGNFQFRLEIYQSMKVSLQCEGIKGVGGVTDGDPIGVRSELCSDALPLGQPSRVGIRRQSDGRFKLFVNDALVSEYRSGPPADLRIGTIRNGVGGGRAWGRASLSYRKGLCMAKKVKKVKKTVQCSDIPPACDPTLLPSPESCGRGRGRECRARAVSARSWLC